MTPKSLYIGLMSGTSLDGIDAVLVEFAPKTIRLVGSHSQALPPSLQTELLALTQPGENEIDRLGEAETQLADQFAAAVNQLLEKTDTKPSRVTAIGSHGQTLRHRPELPHPFTLQIGDPSRIAEKTGMTVVADFRRRDLAAGGQGAPLVPAFHAQLFRSHDIDRVIINVGGMANITLLPRAQNAEVSGYDTGPGNVLLDSWIKQQKGLNYDSDGQWAASGNVCEQLLEQMLATAYFKLPAPKSTGRELFNLQWITDQLAAYGQPCPAQDLQATLTELTARSVAEAIANHNLTTPEVYVCGGGARNSHLLKRLNALLTPCSLRTTDSLGLPAEWVEAVAFAWLAQRCLARQPGNLPAVTGASGPRVLGAIYPP